MTLSETLNLVGRVLVAAYFLWATWFNISGWGHNIAEFKRVGITFGRTALVLGLVAQAAGSVMLLPGTVFVGGVLLIAFTLAADVLFHRYWTYSAPEEQILHKFFLFEHAALNGGILGLIAAHS